MTLATFKEWAQTIVLVGSVIASCVVLVFKVGGYTSSLETAIKNATALGTQAVAENKEQHETLRVLVAAESRRAKEEEEDRAEARREASASRGSGIRRGRSFDR